MTRTAWILGLNAYHGDASAVLVRDGQLIAAVEEERFRRVKHWAGFPAESIRRLLEMADVRGRDITHVAVSRNPRAHLHRKAWFALRHRPDRGLVTDRLRNARRVGDLATPLNEALGVPATALPRVYYVEHHRAHLASTFFVSPFGEAACCAIDGFGDFVSTSMAVGRRGELDLIHRTFFPHSLGVIYTAITQLLGFMGYGDEFKVMGLAPYGKPAHVDAIRQLVTLRPHGEFALNLRFFRHWSDGVTMEWADGYPTLGRLYTPDLEAILGPARASDEPLTPRHEDIAHSLQAVYEECAYHVLNGLWERTRLPALCLAGGCAMNSVANGKVRLQTPFRDVYIQPASGDNGTALGAAFDVWHRVLGGHRGFVMRHGYWGPAHHEADVLADLPAQGADGRPFTVERFESSTAVARATARLIAEGNVVGWYQDRMEWGARALGNRSIVADPRRSDVRELINTKIKFREKFRPFAPSIAAEAVPEYFVGAVADPFMIQVYPVRPEKRSVIPAVTHVDGSGRLQTVSADTNPLYYRLIKEFEALTGVPVILNTSFNENEPIVDTPRQALDCFLRTNMDAIVLGNTMVRRTGASVETGPRRVAALSGASTAREG
jgi:carbamoyltransferase